MIKPSSPPVGMESEVVRKEVSAIYDLRFTIYDLRFTIYDF